MLGNLEILATYTIKRSQSAQIFWPGGNCGLAGAGRFSGAWTCLSPAMPLFGAVIIPESGSGKEKCFKMF